MTFDFQSSRQYLQGFEFQTLFLENLNWSRPTSKRVEPIEPTYVTLKNPKTGQADEYFFIRTGNSTNKLEKTSEITKYIKQRWK